jgi:hypothetical protein
MTKSRLKAPGLMPFIESPDLAKAQDREDAQRAAIEFKEERDREIRRLDMKLAKRVDPNARTHEERMIAIHKLRAELPAATEEERAQSREFIEKRIGKPAV